MKITIECTPSDAADALLHLLDGGAASADSMARPGDEDKIVIYRDESGVKGVNVFGVPFPERSLTDVSWARYGTSDFFDVEIHYSTDKIEFREVHSTKGGDA